MKPSALNLAAILASAVSALATFTIDALAQRAEPQPPVDISQLPYIEIFSPTFFWNDEPDFVRMGSTTCPKGRAVAGGVKIDRGHASLRILESYPDGESWVMRVVNRHQPSNIQSLQIRGFALCMLPAARKGSMLISQYPTISHLSTVFALPSGYASTNARRACQPGGLVVSGGFGLDANQRAPSLPRLELSYPDPNGWNIRAVNGAAPTVPAAGARVHAVCLGGKDGAGAKPGTGGNAGAGHREFQSVFFVDKDITVKYGNATERQSVSCGDDQAFALAGGMRTLRGKTSTIEMQESFPDSPTSWTIAVTNRGNRRDGNATIKLYAVCIKK